MTTTVPVSAQSIGTGSNKGEGLFPFKVTIAATTTAFAVEGRIVNGAAGYRKQDVRVWYVSAPTSVTAAVAVAMFANSARYVDVIQGPNAADDRARLSLLEPVLGTYIYGWCDVPLMSTASTLYVSVVELP